MENNALKIVVESHIPFIRGVFEQTGAEVTYLEPGEFTNETIRHADAIVVRTRTHCNSALLQGSRCRMVATATIGTDHIDSAWCAANGIAVANAPGCNAPAVAQYVAGCVATATGGESPRGLKLGIVGVGHVGGVVDRWARSLGMTTLLCDPPLGLGITLPQLVAEADIITFHTPLTSAPAPWPTRHMFDAALLKNMEDKLMVINSARGPVTDTAALLEAAASGRCRHLAIDCWEGEPDINRQLLEQATIATPHIAGYSLQGKIRATTMAVQAVCAHFGLSMPRIDAPVLYPVPEGITLEDAREAALRLKADTAALKACPDNFELMRNTYDLRREPLQTKTKPS